MDKRKLIVSGIGVLILVGSIFISKFLGSQENLPPEQEKSDAAVVKTLTVKNDMIQSKLSITGRVEASDKVDIYAEVGGVSSFGSKPFKTGNSFNKGDLLIKIDESEFKSSLISTKSQFVSTIASVLPDIKLDFPTAFESYQAFLNKIDVYKPIPALPSEENDQLRLFLTGRGIYTNYHKIKEAETRLAKYEIRAPFTGSLTEALVNEGTLVRVGQQLGEFIKVGVYELEASVPNLMIAKLSKGMQVNFKEISGLNSYSGKLIRINDKLDPGTQLIKIYFEIKSDELKSGMYLDSDLEVNTFENAFKLPLSSLLEGQYVYVIEKDLAKKVNIKLLYQDTESIIVSGLKDQAEVIIDKKNSSFEGSKVIKM